MLPNSFGTEPTPTGSSLITARTVGAWAVLVSCSIVGDPPRSGAVATPEPSVRSRGADAGLAERCQNPREVSKCFSADDVMHDIKRIWPGVLRCVGPKSPDEGPSTAILRLQIGVDGGVATATVEKRGDQFDEPTAACTTDALRPLTVKSRCAGPFTCTIVLNHFF